MKFRVTWVPENERVLRVKYTAQITSDRASTIRSVLKQHDLDPDNFTNVTELTEDVDAYCRSGSSSESLEKATDWTSSTW